MKKATAASVALVAAMMAGPAWAAPCKGLGSASAKPVFYYTANHATLDGLDLTLVIGLEPATAPRADIAKLKDACVRTTFVAGSHTWTLHGDDGDTFPRWATTPGEKAIFYLASMPSPDLVHAWAEAKRTHPTHEPSATFKSSIWAFVAANGDQRSVFGFYDQLPDDERLIQAMQGAIAGQTPAILGFSVKSAKTDEGRIFQPVTLAVVKSNGSVTPVDKVDPDGVAFESVADGAVRARLSGLTCPRALGHDLQRSGIFTTGGVDGSQEAGCRYVGERARLAVVETHLRGGDSLKDLAALVLPPMLPQSRKNPPPPLPEPGDWGEPGVAVFVHALDEARQGAILLKRDAWFIEVYALYGADEDRAIDGALTALAAANAPRSGGSGPPASGVAPVSP